MLCCLVWLLRLVCRRVTELIVVADLVDLDVVWWFNLFMLLDVLVVGFAG